MSKSKKLRKLIKAAKRGKPYSQYQLGIRFQTGYGVTMDLQMAAWWMQLAAKSEYVPAKEWLSDYSFDDNATIQTFS